MNDDELIAGLEKAHAPARSAKLTTVGGLVLFGVLGAVIYFRFFRK